jgi:hypothetical protein
MTMPDHRRYVGWMTDDLIDIAEYQRLLIRLILFQVLLFIVQIPLGPSLFLALLSVIPGLLTIVVAYRLVVTLRLNWSSLYLLSLFVPFVKLITIYLLSKRASQVLKSQGLRVTSTGITGAELRRLKTGS